MWLDNASDIDMLFYQPYANLISDIAQNKDYNPLTIGVHGLWGAGKSTLLKLIEKNISADNEKVICVQINAWMFEGYEDAKTALMETLLKELGDETHKSIFGKVYEKITSLLKRIDFFKAGTTLVSAGAPIIASIATGNLLPVILSIVSDKNSIAESISSATTTIQEIKDSTIKEKDKSTVENIRKFKDDFEKMLEDAEVENVVVLVDDLDRCTPERIIETLEAIKLFLSVKRTTFIVAADETVIEYAIKKKYPPLDNSPVVLSNEYIEKIIQLPIYIPELSSKDIENYLLLLVVQMYLKKDSFKDLLIKIYDQKLVVRENCILLTELQEIINSLSNPFCKNEEEFKKDATIINGIKDIVSSTLKGNPRQTKRFLNTFVTKKALAQMYFANELDMRVLAKLLTLQKLSPDLFRQLNEWNKKFTICNDEFQKMYDTVTGDKHPELRDYNQWATPIMLKWLQCEPKELQQIRLDKYFYLSRENLHSSVINVNEFSAEARQVLDKIGTANEVNIELIMIALNRLDPVSINNVFSVLLSRIEENKLQFFIIKSLFLNCTSYRGKIVDSLKRVNSKFDPSTIPYFKTMLSADHNIMTPLLEAIKGHSLPEQQYKLIIGKELQKKRGN